MHAGVRAILALYHHSMVLKTDGSVWVTGRNNFGQLGDGTLADKNRFVMVVASGQWGYRGVDY